MQTLRKSDTVIILFSNSILLTFLNFWYTHTRLTALFLGLPGWASTRKVKPIWILLKQETVSGSGISWAICKSASRSKQITMPVPHHSVFYMPDALPAAQPTASKHWRLFSIFDNNAEILSISETKFHNSSILVSLHLTFSSLNSVPSVLWHHLLGNKTISLLQSFLNFALHTWPILEWLPENGWLNTRRECNHLGKHARMHADWRTGPKQNAFGSQ